MSVLPCIGSHTQTITSWLCHQRSCFHHQSIHAGAPTASWLLASLVLYVHQVSFWLTILYSFVLRACYLSRRLCTIGRSLIPQPDCFHFPPCALFCSVPHPAISTVTCALFLLLIPGASHQSQGSLPKVHLILVWMLLAELRRFASALKASPKTRSNTQLT